MTSKGSTVTLELESNTSSHRAESESFLNKEDNLEEQKGNRDHRGLGQGCFDIGVVPIRVGTNEIGRLQSSRAVDRQCGGLRTTGFPNFEIPEMS
ncbi:hypothetical protein TgHK011_001291 [Trichoderma gracile]|nr:hypothetical protein TgHK011_001291 [Trichoderma gracile]